MPKPPGDIAARMQALSPVHSFHVESPAGAGKTSLLTARFIRLLAAVTHPYEILALTFTNKAANEMRERIGSILRQAEKATHSNEPWINSLIPYAQAALKKHARHINLLKSPDGLRIMTFHSFCFHLIKQAPWEAQVPLETVVASDEDQANLITEAVLNAQREIFALPPEDPVRHALERRLMHMNNNWLALEAELKHLLAQRDLLADLIREVKSALDKEHLYQILTKRLDTFISFRLEELRSYFSATELGSNWPSLYLPFDIPKALPGSTWHDLPAWLSIANLCLTQKGTPRRQFRLKDGFPEGFKHTHWAKYIKGLPENVSSLLHSLRELPLPDTPTTDLETLFDLILLVSKTIEIYNAICQRHGVIDYVELEWAALRALAGEESPTDLQLFLDQKVTHILVDEFQDTSRNQWQLLQYLCAGWQPGDGRTVFIVGDPKQSIYGFRKAEVSIFTEAKKGIPIPGQGKLGLISVNLTTNFRSCAGLIDFTNEIFGQSIMINPNPEADEVTYQDFLPAPEQKKARGKITLAIFTKNDETLDEPRWREAVWLAQEVKRVSKNCKNQTIGILLPTRTYLATYLKALAKQGLQVQVQEGILLKERPEVMDILSLTRALVRPHDHLAWTSIFRSAWCWMDLHVLYDISRQRATSWKEKIKTIQSDTVTPKGLKNLWASINQYMPHTGRRPLAEIVSAIWEEVNGPAAVCARFGPAGVENCRRFLQILTRSETGIPEETLTHLELFMETAYAPPDPLAVRSPVQIMTIHRAKGLEFDFVFLPYLDWNPLGNSSKDSPPYLLERLPGSTGERLIALSPDKRMKEKDKTYNLLKKLWKKRRLGESKRLFYVAATRAKRELYLSGLATERSGEYIAARDSFLSYLLAHKNTKTQSQFLQDPTVCTLPGKKLNFPLEKGLPTPTSFIPEKLIYQITSPSSLKPETPLPEKKYKISTSGSEAYNLARGTVIHRIFEYLTKGKNLPTENAVAAAMLAEGVDEYIARDSAPGILAEIKTCLEEEFCSYILSSHHPFAASEWLLEDHPAAGAPGRKTETVRSGIIDRVVFDGHYWWLVDYKTAPVSLGTDLQEFLQEQAIYYREQLKSYREMLVGVRQIDPAKIRLILYFTAIPKAYEIKD